MKLVNVLKSKEDASVNFVFEKEPARILEARYVRRARDYFACYLSSQSGCAKNCRMCHLTATGQNKADNALLEDFMAQADAVLEHYDKECPPAEIVHYNFMARGEAFDNP